MRALSSKTLGDESLDYFAMLVLEENSDLLNCDLFGILFTLNVLLKYIFKFFFSMRSLKNTDIFTKNIEKHFIFILE